jgi:ferric-dicitrate binding protein FerR (iron transport regulator)
VAKEKVDPRREAAAEQMMRAAAAHDRGYARMRRAVAAMERARKALTRAREAIEAIDRGREEQRADEWAAWHGTGPVHGVVQSGAIPETFCGLIALDVRHRYAPQDGEVTCPECLQVLRADDPGEDGRTWLSLRPLFRPASP